MIRSIGVALLTTATISCLAGIALAGNPESQSGSYPVLGQLELRDRTVTLTVVPNGYLYSVTDQSGAVLNADLTEDQLAEHYPDLIELLRPAVAGGEANIMMLAPSPWITD